MATSVIREKIFTLETELALLKKTLKKELDFTVDEKNWKQIRAQVKRTRADLYRSRYGKK
ncbi:hypothetical protein HY250_04770 [Candidatus Azambacteria bacterium]|nr:hypothetical protein [Candidatus Azambacteria bacterium]MBI3685692.1 hypothetical protein [Candidatus Azambacteria bacterium]